VIKLHLVQSLMIQVKRTGPFFYIILIALLIGINVFLYVKYNQKSTENEKLTEQVNQDSIRISQLTAAYDSAVVEVQSYKMQNATLDSLLDARNAELDKIKSALLSAKKSGKLSEENYQKQIKDLNDIIANLNAQISELQTKLGVQIAKNDSLGKSLSQQIIITNQVTKEKNKYQTRANLLTATGISATGTFGKKSGKEKDTNNAKKTERLKVSFNAGSTTAEPGQKTFLCRIIGPGGTTLAIQSQGSGIFQMAESGDDKQYSMKKSIDFKQEDATVTMYWEQNTPFDAGTYTVELFQDGYSLGTTTFELK